MRPVLDGYRGGWVSVHSAGGKSVRVACWRAAGESCESVLHSLWNCRLNDQRTRCKIYKKCMYSPLHARLCAICAWWVCWRLLMEDRSRMIYHWRFFTATKMLNMCRIVRPWCTVGDVQPAAPCIVQNCSKYRRGSTLFVMCENRAALPRFPLV